MLRTPGQAPRHGGADTHAKVHVAAVMESGGPGAGHQAFPSTAAGYRPVVLDELITRATPHGPHNNPFGRNIGGQANDKITARNGGYSLVHDFVD